MAYREVIITSTVPNLVLDASEVEVKIHKINQSPFQVWTIEPAGHGKHYIVNKGNGKVLAVEGRIQENSSIITHDRSGAVNPEWYINSDNTIASSSGNYALDIFNGSVVAGAAIQAYPNSASANQKFYIHNA